MKDLDQHIIDLATQTSDMADCIRDAMEGGERIQGIRNEANGSWLQFHPEPEGDGVGAVYIQPIMDLAKMLAREPSAPRPARDVKDSLTVEAVHRDLAKAVLSDGQFIPITTWLGADANGEIDEVEAQDAICASAGPDSDGKWYAIDLSAFDQSPH